MGHGACTSFFYYERDRSANSRSQSESLSEQDDGITAINQWFSDLTDEEVTCWAFGIVPSELQNYLWKFSQDDIRFKVKTTYGLKKAQSVEFTQSLSYIATLALGGKPKVKVKPTRNSQQGEAAFSSIFGANSVSSIDGVDPFENLDGIFEKLDKING